jgi:membrane protease YdiL (CAAX protease family)
MIRQYILGDVLALISLAVTMPVLEELLFRGRLFSILARGRGNMVAILETSCVFVATHILIEESSAAWVLRAWYGIGFGVTRIIGRSVYANIMGHIVCSAMIIGIG